jgi:formate hydrogenlyase transcriptional activator
MARAPHSRPPLVLVVDDTPANLGVLLEILNANGFDVSIAEDGESALEQASYVRPDLILLDVVMPAMDGFAACRELKQRSDTRDIPVIFMSALSDTEGKVRGFELGAVDYITKPFQTAEVLARVNTHLALQRLKQSLQQSEERLSRIVESALDAIIVFDRDGIVLLFNRAAERVFRCGAGEALGRQMDDLLSQPLRKVLAEYRSTDRADSALPAPTFIAEGHRAARADGESFAIEASLSCAEASGQVIYTLILRDIDERMKAQAEMRHLQGLNRYLEDELRSAKAGTELVGASAGLRAVLQQVQQVASTDATVLICGETGTGKELIAEAIHASSPRSAKPLVKLNCAALPANLIESELYGHERGAFTGALARRAGRFELADGGTLFLDEIGELPLDLQAKLLRVLQQGEFERVGGSVTLKVDVRIVAATNRDFAQEVAAGRFRADLYYRLNVFPITLPPLRDRKPDIVLLSNHFLRGYASKYGKRIEALSDSQAAVLSGYGWPGNVRELQHVIERAVILTQGTRLALGDWFTEPSPVPAAATATEAMTLEEADRAHILKVLGETAWRVSGKAGAAERLGVKPTTLESRMKRLGITRKA